SSFDMADMLWWTVPNTIMAAILAAFVALICGLARPRPAVRHALWLVVLVKLLSPPLISWPWTTHDLGQPVLHWLTPDDLPTAENDRLDEPDVPAHFSSPVPESEPEIVFIPDNPQEESPLTTPELLPANASSQNADSEDLEG